MFFLYVNSTPFFILVFNRYREFYSISVGKVKPFASFHTQYLVDMPGCSFIQIKQGTCTRYTFRKKKGKRHNQENSNTKKGKRCSSCILHSGNRITVQITNWWLPQLKYNRCVLQSLRPADLKWRILIKLPVIHFAAFLNEQTSVGVSTVTWHRSPVALGHTNTAKIITLHFGKFLNMQQRS